MTQELHVVCPGCQTLNRVHAGRTAQGPTCGKCGVELLPENPVEVDRAGLDRRIEESDLPLLVDFWAPWCGPCRAMGPAYAQAVTRFRGRIVAAKLNTQDNPGTAKAFGVTGIPTLMLFHGNRMIARKSGSMASGAIVKWIEQGLAKIK